MKTAYSSQSDIYDTSPDIVKHDVNIMHVEEHCSNDVLNIDLSYSVIQNPMKDIFINVDLKDSKIKKIARKDDAEILIQCFKNTFYRVIEKFDGKLNQIEIVEDEDSTDIAWRYRKSIIYFSLNNTSSLLSYGAIIDEEGSKEQKVFTGRIDPDIKMKAIDYQEVVDCQLARIIKG